VVSTECFAELLEGGAGYGRLWQARSTLNLT
jgi:hypothetical protein